MSVANRVRITGGRHRGVRVRVPNGARPTSSRVREALFSIWSPRISDARMLDLFAGSGVVGLEALSRGASHVRFVEGNRVAAGVLEESCRSLEGEGSGWEVVVADLPGTERSRWRRPGPEGPYDLAFIDAPYAWRDHEPLLELLTGILDLGGRIALEHSSRVAIPQRSGAWRLADSRSYGESTLSFYRREGGASSSSVRLRR